MSPSEPEPTRARKRAGLGRRIRWDRLLALVFCFLVWAFIGWLMGRLL